jgi:cellulose synthase/poly-beta-1,6-N-acetylglucosamine synthase-like glycosyltransferase
MEASYLETAISIGSLGGWLAGLLLWVIGSDKALSRSRPQEHTSPAKIPVSVIIAAHDAAHSLPQLLSDLETQLHPNTEVILVNDRSTDGTGELLAKRSESWLRVYNITETPAGWTGKKWALTEGIRNASHDMLLFTDADCRVGPNWVASMTEPFSRGVELVLGLSSIDAERSLSNLLQRYDNLWFGLQLVSCTGWGQPVLALGRNLAYRKTLFDRAQGFASHADQLSGDDDLLVAGAADPSRTECVVQSSAQTTTIGHRTLFDYFQQRRRHITTSLQYPRLAKICFGAWGGLELMMPVGCLMFAVVYVQLGGAWWVGLLLASYLPGLLRLRALSVVHQTSLQGADLAIWVLLSPVFELLHYIFTVALALSLPFKKKSW